MDIGVYSEVVVRMFFKIGVLNNFADLTGENLCWSLFLIKLQAFKGGLSDCNGTRTHKYLVHKRTLNHLAKLATIERGFTLKHVLDMIRTCNLRWLLLYIQDPINIYLMELFSENTPSQIFDRFLSIPLVNIFLVCFLKIYYYKEEGREDDLINFTGLV